jgi:peptidoglycan/LPS O-acetylase OafA/YrhL
MLMADPTPHTAEGGHRPQLDSLRAFAVLGVLLAHTMPWMQDAFDTGAAGVRLFFVLSGFLITGILLRARAAVDSAGVRRGHVLRAFYARRFLRIFPAYFGILFAALALGLPQVRETLAWHLAYLSNFFAAIHGWPRPYLGHLWSLSVEEQFYLLWPAVILFTPSRYLSGTLLGTVCVGPPARLLFTWLVGDPVRGSTPTLPCLDSLGLGAVLALAHQAGPAAQRRTARLCLGAGTVLLAAVLASSLLKFGWPFRVACKDLAFALLFTWLVDRAHAGFGGPARWVLQWPPLVYAGSISYGIYLYHEFLPPLLHRLDAWLPAWLHFPAQPGPAKFLYVAATTIPVAALSWHLFEKPLNNRKRHFPYVPRPTASPGGQDRVRPAAARRRDCRRGRAPVMDGHSR